LIEAKTEIIMSTKLFVGNLPHSLTENRIAGFVRQAWPRHGKVNLMQDGPRAASRFWIRDHGHPRRGAAATKALNGKDVEGRALTVNEARRR